MITKSVTIPAVDIKITPTGLINNRGNGAS